MQMVIKTSISFPLWIFLLIQFSDNAWNGSALKSSEDTLKYTAGSVVTAGTILSYSGTVSGDWSTEDAGFNPSGSGDNILVFQGISVYPPLGIPRFVVVFDKTNLNTPSTPRRFHFYPAYPNPFNAATILEFEILEKGPVEMTIYSIRGEMVDTIINERFPAGRHSVRWNGNRFPSGIYFCRLKSGSTIKTNKLVLIK